MFSISFEGPSKRLMRRKWKFSLDRKTSRSLPRDAGLTLFPLFWKVSLLTDQILEWLIFLLGPRLITNSTLSPACCSSSTLRRRFPSEAPSSRSLFWVERHSKEIKAHQHLRGGPTLPFTIRL